MSDRYSIRLQVPLSVLGTIIVFVGFGSHAASLVTQNPDPGVEPSIMGGAPTMRLMDERQYTNAISDVFGADIKNTIRFPPVRRTDGLVALGATTAVVTSGALETFEAAARDIAAHVVDEQHRLLIPCRPANAKQPDDACAREFLGRVGRLLYRRPLNADELNVRVAAAQSASEKLNDFYAGLQSALSGFLVAPEFLFLTEATEPDPSLPGAIRLDGYSRATRLSLLLWDTIPDEELLRAAEAGELYTQRGLTRQVDRLLASPLRVQVGVRAFFDDLMVMEAFGDLTKDSTIYPTFSLKIASDAKEQALRIIVDQLVTRNGDYRDLFTTRHIFLTQALGTIYRVPVQAAGATEWVPYELSENDPRAGLLTQVGYLAVNAQPGRTSPTRRGRSLREVFMCQKIPDPPPNVSFTIIEDPNAKYATMRDRATAHSTDKTCAGCHRLTDPIGLGFENFDGAAQFRIREGNALIDASGELDGISFHDGKGLGQAVHDNPNIPPCIVKRLYQYAVGRNISKDEKPVLAYFERRFTDQQYRFVALLRTLVTSKAFYQVSVDAADKPRSVTALNGQ
jgi:hypothetical protein